MRISHSPFRLPGLAASLGLHALLLASAALLMRPMALPQAVEQVVMVELVAAPLPVDETSSAAATAASAPVETNEQASADTPTTLPSDSDMIEATQMLSGAALADPRNAEARRMLNMIETSLRREQVCGIEAMEQIKSRQPDWSPECVISYALTDTRIEGNTVTAEGAVVQSGAHWYRLEYECTLGTDLASVTTFRYRIGEPVSEMNSSRLGLAPCM